MSRIAWIIVLAAAVAAGPAFAETADPRSMSCEFNSGTSTSYVDGSFTSKPPSPLSFTIFNIDLDGQSAELEGKAGTTSIKLRVVRAINANHYLEVVNEGFLNLTTIYDKDPATGRHPAVHSRHFGILGQPVFAQYTGTCSEN